MFTGLLARIHMALTLHLGLTHLAAFGPSSKSKVMEVRFAKQRSYLLTLRLYAYLASAFIEKTSRYSSCVTISNNAGQETERSAVPGLVLPIMSYVVLPISSSVK